MDLEKLEMAANAGQAGAQALLGLCFLDGVGTSIDYSQALKWLTMAADNGSPRAKANLALMYQQGLGVHADLSKTEALFLQASEKQEFMATIGLARLYAKNENIGQAVYWYQVLLDTADQNNHEQEIVEAQNFLSLHK